MKTQISNAMLFAIIINMVFPKAIGVTQGVIARQAGGDMWIVTLISTLIGLMIMWLTVVVIQRLPQKNIFEQTKVLVGKWGEKLVALMIFFFFLGAYAAIMLTVVYHLRDYFLPDVPIYIFIILVTLVGIYGVLKGIEVASRVAIIGIFSIIALNILLLIGSLDFFEIKHLLPVLRNGLLNTVEVTKHLNADWAVATLMVAIILPMVKQKEKWKKYTRKAIICGGGMIIMWPILEVGVITPEVTGQYIVACMQMARSAEIGLFVHRYELIMIVFFAFSSLTQIMVCLFCASVSAKHIVGGQKLNLLLIPVSLLLGGFSYWVIDDHIRAMDLLTYYWPYIAMAVAFGIPIVIFLLGLVFKKKLSQENQNISMT